MSSTSWFLLIISISLGVDSRLIGAETAIAPDHSAEVPAATMSVTPAYARVEVATGEHAAVVLTLQVPEATTILAVSADCGCLKSRDVLPRRRRVATRRCTCKQRASCRA